MYYRFFFLFIWTVVVWADMPLYWWRPAFCTNFGDELSCAIVERMMQKPIRKACSYEKKMLAVGSILHFASDGDIIWGSGINGKHPKKEEYSFSRLDVRAVRGPKTKAFLEEMGIRVPEVFGDPALLLPYLFPEFCVTSKRDFLIISHIGEIDLVRVHPEEYVVKPTDPWQDVVRKITESKFIISSSLHGIIVAEAFGIPARLLRLSEAEPLFKYEDYYLGTGRKTFSFATSVYEALQMGGELPIIFDPVPLFRSFPFDAL